MTDNLAREMYKEHILEHYKNPQNYGELAKATHSQTEYNPLCGDKLTIQLIVEDDKISDIKFTGQGCAISMAAASLLTEKLKGQNISEVENMNRDNMMELLKIPVGPARIKCVLLSLEAVRRALK